MFERVKLLLNSRSDMPEDKAAVDSMHTSICHVTWHSIQAS